MNVILKSQFVIYLFITLIYPFAKINSQTDSVKTSYRQESSDSSDYSYHRKFQYLDIHLKDETKLLKVAYTTYSNKDEYLNYFNLIINYEHKIGRSFSGYLETNILLSPLETRCFDFELPKIGIRYYPLKTKQIKQGISGNNTSGWYLDFNSPLPIYEDYYYDNHLRIGIGTQTRLNNWAFIDIYAYTIDNFTIMGLSFKLGLVKGWR